MHVSLINNLIFSHLALISFGSASAALEMAAGELSDRLSNNLQVDRQREKWLT